MNIHVGSEQLRCPCCGSPVDSVPVEALTEVTMSFPRKSILRRLAQAYPRHVSSDALMEAVYDGAKTPANPRIVLAVQLHEIRRIVEPFGWTIPRGRGGQGNRAHYRLARIPSE